MNLDQTVIQVHIEDIIPNRFQPRLNFDEEALQELAESIKEHGIIQPLVLRKLGDKYEIIAGERRYKAATMAGLSTVPAVIANIDDNRAAEVAIVENVQRKNLTAIEEARSYKNLLDKGYLTQEGLAKKMGLSQPAIANKLRLLNLDDEVQQALLDEKISERHARTLLTIPDKETQKEWLHRIINERLTVRQLDNELKKSNTKVDPSIIEEDGSEGGVPIVDNKPSIEDIKANSVDIFGNDNSSVEEKMKPTETINEEIETLDLEEDSDDSDRGGNSFISVNDEPVIEEPQSTDNLPNNSFEELNPPRQEENKFFTFNDVEENNTISDNNIDNNDTNEPIMEPIEQNDNNSFEIIDFSNNNDNNNEDDNEGTTGQDNPFLATEKDVQEPINMEEKDNYENDFNISSNNKFFTPALNERKTVEIVNENKVENPMDRVKALSQENNVGANEQGELSLKDIINTVRDNLKDLGDKGVYAEVEEIDFPNYYQITVKIPKDE